MSWLLDVLERELPEDGIARDELAQKIVDALPERIIAAAIAAAAAVQLHARSIADADEIARAIGASAARDVHLVLEPFVETDEDDNGGGGEDGGSVQ